MEKMGYTSRLISRLAVIILFLSCQPLSAKSQIAPRCDPPDAKIIDISWRGAILMGTTYIREGAFSIDIKNTGTKIITKISWEFFLIDKVRQRKYDHFKFRTDDKTINPGDTKRLTKRFDYHTTPNYISALARITELTYSDGTKWQCEQSEQQTSNSTASPSVNTSPVRIIRQYLQSMGVSIDETKSNPRMVVTRCRDNNGEENILVIGYSSDQKVGFYIYNFGSLKKASKKEDVLKYLHTLNDTITVGNFFVDKDEDIGYQHIISSEQPIGKAAFESIYFTMTKVAIQQRAEIHRLISLQ